jgi:hypothetical protein
MSAGARLPGPNKMRSPTTSSEAAISAGVPPRTTVAVGAPSVDSAAIARLARTSLNTSIPDTMTMTARMVSASSTSPSRK